jgi:hypothetical protein
MAHRVWDQAVGASGRMRAAACEGVGRTGARRQPEGGAMSRRRLIRAIRWHVARGGLAPVGRGSAARVRSGGRCRRWVGYLGLSLARASRGRGPGEIAGRDRAGATAQPVSTVETSPLTDGGRECPGLAWSEAPFARRSPKPIPRGGMASPGRAGDIGARPGSAARENPDMSQIVRTHRRRDCPTHASASGPAWRPVTEQPSLPTVTALDRQIG